MPAEPEEEDEPLTPEQEARFAAESAAWLRAHEAKATQLYGPPELRRRKNQRFAARLVAKYSEPVIRSLLAALSGVKDLLCTQFLAEMDLAGAPLWEIIQPFELGGIRFHIVAVQMNSYTVEIGAGFGTAGDGGKFVIAPEGNRYAVKQTLRSYIC
jgi:hypothetical protein